MEERTRATYQRSPSLPSSRLARNFDSFPPPPPSYRLLLVALFLCISAPQTLTLLPVDPGLRKRELLAERRRRRRRR